MRMCPECACAFRPGVDYRRPAANDEPEQVWHIRLQRGRTVHLLECPEESASRLCRQCPVFTSANAISGNGTLGQYNRADQCFIDIPVESTGNDLRLA